jgi:hypothetical protein
MPAITVDIPKDLAADLDTPAAIRHLDIAFREDASRIRERRAANNFAVLHPIAAKVLRRDTTIKGGLQTKRLVAGRSEDYLANLSFQTDA